MKKNHTSNGAGPHSVIALRAYQLWETAEKPEGRSIEFWLAAEEELTLTQVSAKKQLAAKKALPNPQPKSALTASRLVKPPAKVTAKAPAKAAATARTSSKGIRSRG